MSRRRLHFLTSVHAIEAHLLCLGLIGFLSFDLCRGKGKPDYAMALALVVVFYPVLLFLIWFQERSRQRDAIQYAIDYHAAPEKLRRTRRRWRLGAFLFAFAIGGLLDRFGHQGLLIEGLPAQYFGYVLYGMCVLAAAGVNVWYGGPLDPRFDPPPAQPGDERRD